MEEGCEDEVDYHQDERAPGFGYGEQSDHADDCKVDACCCLLKGTRVHKTLSVDVGVEDK